MLHGGTNLHIHLLGDVKYHIINRMWGNIRLEAGLRGGLRVAFWNAKVGIGDLTIARYCLCWMCVTDIKCAPSLVQTYVVKYISAKNVWVFLCTVPWTSNVWVVDCCIHKLIIIIIITFRTSECTRGKGKVVLLQAWNGPEVSQISWRW